MSPYFGYLMICYVDSDILVLLRRRRAGQPGQPGLYAAALFHRSAPGDGQLRRGRRRDDAQLHRGRPAGGRGGTITGCLFCAIYFDEVVDILGQSARASGAEVTLIGTRGQIMSSTAGLPYGDSITDVLRTSALFGTTADRLEERLLAARPGTYWSLRNGSLYYTAYQRVEHTGWDVLCSINFATAYAGTLPSLLLVAGLTIPALRRPLMAGAALHRGADEGGGRVGPLGGGVGEPGLPGRAAGGADFQEVLRLTSNGLTDSLTGAVTRSVFLNQAEALLKKGRPRMTQALCFVDMDNLKHLNDSCGPRRGRHRPEEHRLHPPGV